MMSSSGIPVAGVAGTAADGTGVAVALGVGVAAGVITGAAGWGASAILSASLEIKELTRWFGQFIDRIMSGSWGNFWISAIA